MKMFTLLKNDNIKLKNKTQQCKKGGSLLPDRVGHFYPQSRFLWLTYENPWKNHVNGLFTEQKVSIIVEEGWTIILMLFIFNLIAN